MLQIIEEECILPLDGKLPEKFCPVFGQKVKIVILAAGENQDSAAAPPAKRYQTLSVQERVIPSRDEIHER